MKNIITKTINGIIFGGCMMLYSPAFLLAKVAMLVARVDKGVALEIIEVGEKYHNWMNNVLKID